MRRNLDEELKIVQIRYKQREMELEKLREQIVQEREQWRIKNERYQKQQEKRKKREEERKQGERDHKRHLKELERIEHESKERMVKYEAEQEKLNKDTDYYLVTTLIILAIAAVATVVGPILVVFLTRL